MPVVQLGSFNSQGPRIVAHLRERGHEKKRPPTETPSLPSLPCGRSSPLLACQITMSELAGADDAFTGCAGWLGPSYDVCDFEAHLAGWLQSQLLDHRSGTMYVVGIES